MTTLHNILTGDEADLPDKLSDLLRLAVRDAQACKADPRYVLDMMIWHEPGELSSLGDLVGGACKVCMAGAVMARTLRVDSSESSDPVDFNKSIARQLAQIDSMRAGDAVGVWEHSFQRRQPLPPGLAEAMDLVCDHYDYEARRAPWSVYLEEADILEEAGM